MATPANGTRSFDQATIATGASLTAGSVLGKVTASGKYKIHDSAAADGTETAAAILWANVDATSADQQATIVSRDAEVAKGGLTFKSGMSAANKKAALADLESLGIVAR